MSDKEEISDNVIRYTKEIMISLHDSPLVQKPEAMPSLSTWFGYAKAVSLFSLKFIID